MLILDVLAETDSMQQHGNVSKHHRHRYIYGEGTGYRELRAVTAKGDYLSCTAERSCNGKYDVMGLNSVCHRNESLPENTGIDCIDSPSFSCLDDAKLRRMIILL